MKLLLVGDVMLGRLVNTKLKTCSLAYPWGDTLPLFSSVDVRICNLECVLSDGGSPARKVFTFRSDAKNVFTLTEAKIDLVSLANNHALDYGSEALADTLSILDQEGIKYAGAGASLTQAQALAVAEAHATKIGMLAATDTNEPGWRAENEKPGVWQIPIDVHDRKARELIEKIKSAKRLVDLLIISLHWGSNWGYEPEHGHGAFAHALIDAGADIVFGHSPHVFRGIEVYKQKLILYSAGNFVDDYAVDPTERNDESFVFIIHASNKRLQELRAYPTVIKDMQALRAPAPADKRIALKMRGLCEAFHTDTLWDETERCLTVLIP